MRLNFLSLIPRVITGDLGFSIVNMTFELTEGGQSFEYRMGMKMLNRRNMHALSERLKSEASVVEFRIAPEGT